MMSSSALLCKLTNDNIALSIAAVPVVNGVPCKLPEAVNGFIAAALADNTRRAYQGDLADFLHWGGTVPCTPETLAAYIADRAETLSPHTITRRVVGISRAHVSQSLADPAKNDLVRTVLRGVRRKNGTAQRQVAPLLKQDLLAILPHMRGTKGVRDRALILLGFAAALRRSELVALDVHDLQFVNEGLIGRSFTVTRALSCLCAPRNRLYSVVSCLRAPYHPLSPSLLCVTSRFKASQRGNKPHLKYQAQRT